jgi:hypothetical protein
MNSQTEGNKSFFEKTGIDIAQNRTIRIHAAFIQVKEREPENSVLVKSLKKNSNLSRIRGFDRHDFQ